MVKEINYLVNNLQVTELGEVFKNNIKMKQFRDKEDLAIKKVKRLPKGYPLVPSGLIESNRVGYIQGESP